MKKVLSIFVLGVFFAWMPSMATHPVWDTISTPHDSVIIVIEDPILDTTSQPDDPVITVKVIGDSCFPYGDSGKTKCLSYSGTFSDSNTGTEVTIKTSGNPGTQTVTVKVVSNQDTSQEVLKAIDVELSGALDSVLTEATLCISYDGLDLKGYNLWELQIFHFDRQVWVPIPTYTDTGKKCLVVTVSHFSIYGIAPKAPVALQTRRKAGFKNPMTLFPNPARGNLKIQFSVPKGIHAIQVKVMDLNGRVLNQIVSGTYNQGVYQVNWNEKDHKGQRIAQGIYLVQFKSGSKVFTQKVNVLK